MKRLLLKKGEYNMTYKSENEKRELKRKTLKKQIHQHNLTLWKALNLSYQ